MKKLFYKIIITDIGVDENISTVSFVIDRDVNFIEYLSERLYLPSAAKTIIIEVFNYDENRNDYKHPILYKLHLYKYL